VTGAGLFAVVFGIVVGLIFWLVVPIARYIRVKKNQKRFEGGDIPERRREWRKPERHPDNRWPW
jgi:hypothetical protein